MTREEIMRLAQEAGYLILDEKRTEWLERFANLVIEECAKVCDDQAEYADEHLTDSAWRAADRCAAAIRARKSK